MESVAELLYEITCSEVSWAVPFQKVGGSLGTFLGMFLPSYEAVVILGAVSSTVKRDTCPRACCKDREHRATDAL